MIKTLSAMAVILAGATLCAQDIAPAPLPTQLSTGSKVFVSNAGEQDNIDSLRAYNEFYGGMVALKRFQPVLAPADADLILELHNATQVGSSGGGNSTSIARLFRLSIIDPRTHVILWSITEDQKSATFQSNRNKNLDDAIAKLVEDLGKLTGPSPTAPTDKQKVRVR